MNGYQPDVIVLYRKHVSNEEVNAMLALPEWRKYSWIPPDCLPESCQDKVIVLLQQEEYQRVVRKPKR